MISGPIYRVRTVAANHFAAAAVAGAALALESLDCTSTGNVKGDHEAIAAGRHMRARLRELRIVSQQNLGWELWLFGTNVAGLAVIGNEKFLGRWTFAVADGVQAAADSFWYYYINGLDLGYQDQLNAGKIYARLIPRNGNKLAQGVGGDIEIEFGFELLQGR